jgi:hypothetical protein
MRIDAFGDPRAASHIPDDLADALAGQHIRRWPRALLTAGKQRSRPPRADVQPQQLGQLAPHRHLSTLAALAVADRDHALGETDILYPELHQFGGTSAGLQQGLQHHAGPPILGVGLIEEAQFLPAKLDKSVNGAQVTRQVSTITCLSPARREQFP